MRHHISEIKNPLVVGYKGEIGSFILSGLLKVMPKALSIWCVDINETEEEVKQRIKASDVIFLCIPFDKTLSWMDSYFYLLGDKVIIEQCSLKEWVYEYEPLSRLDIRSMHVLFRPSQTPNLEDRRVGLIKDQFEPPIVDFIEKVTQSKIVWYKDEHEHDKEMAVQQALLHRTLLILDKMLHDCNGSTYISKKVLELSDRIKKGDLELYSKIQGNKHLPDVLENFEYLFNHFKIEDYWKNPDSI